LPGAYRLLTRPFMILGVGRRRNFANKIWNIARYVEGRVGDNHHLRTEALPQTPADHWIISRVNNRIERISKAMERYRLSEAYEIMYHFVWHDFADWYVEASKIENNQGLLAHVLESVLKIPIRLRRL
jgi:valyl-tRNA synthetase